MSRSAVYTFQTFTSFILQRLKHHLKLVDVYPVGQPQAVRPVQHQETLDKGVPFAALASGVVAVSYSRHSA
jgi:hypothetical protein